MKNDVNICFICDKSYVIPTIVAISSLKENRDKGRPYKIYVILTNKDDNAEKLFFSMTEYNFIVHIINYTDKNLSFYENNNREICVASVSAILKFNLPEIFYYLDKILFLDGDILIEKDLSELYDNDLNGVYAGVVKDSGAMYYRHEFVRKVDNYFNSGVMLLNLKALRRDNVTQVLYDTKKDLKNDNLMDQNVFNIVFDKKIKLLSIKYNLLIVNLLRAKEKWDMQLLNDFFGENLLSFEELVDSSYIKHYSSKDKPWKNDSNIDFKKWYYYLSKSAAYQKRRESFESYVCKYNDFTIYRENKKYKKYKVSIIVPVYNTFKFLQNSLNSILLQTLRDIEIIIVDDGSTDGSRDLLRHYSDIDDRIKLILLNKNCGQSVARNIGMDNASGEYLYFFDSDDFLKANSLESLYTLCEQNNLDVIYFSGEAIFEDEMLRKQHLNYTKYYKRNNIYNGIYKGDKLYSELVNNFDYKVSPCLQMINREYLVSNNIKFYEGIIYEDNIFSFEVIINSNKAMVIDESFFIRNVRYGSTVTSNKTYKNLEGMIIVVYLLECYLQKANELYKKELKSQLLSYRKQIRDIYNNLDVYDKVYIFLLEDRFKKVLFDEIANIEVLDNKKKLVNDIVVDNKKYTNNNNGFNDKKSMSNNKIVKDRFNKNISFENIFYYAGKVIKYYKTFGFKQTIKKIVEKLRF